MLSILIPIFNQNVVDLVTTLSSQCLSAKIDFQILCLDDCSDEPWRKVNQEIGAMYNVSYIELSENIGRARIRNRMAKLAMYDNLLFLDGDSTVVKEDYIRQYLPYIHKVKVVYGGRVYQANKPPQPYILHWTYGTLKEALPSSTRRKNPYLNFMSNNFLAERKIMEAVPFDESFQTYGYEDLLLGQHLEDQQLEVVHIENPIRHDGLEQHQDFLRKTGYAIENLAQSYHTFKIRKSRLIDTYRKLYLFNLDGWLRRKYLKNRENWESRLEGDNPSMFLFAMYKLGMFVDILDKNRKDYNK